MYFLGPVLGQVAYPTVFLTLLSTGIELSIVAGLELSINRVANEHQAKLVWRGRATLQGLMSRLLLELWSCSLGTWNEQ